MFKTCMGDPRVSDLKAESKLFRGLQWDILSLHVGMLKLLPKLVY